MGGAWGELKIQSKNTCEGVHLIVKLPAISLQASKFTKNELLHTYFSRILLDFKLLFVVLLLGIISWKGVSGFNGGIVFQMGGFIFKWGRHPMGGHQFWWKWEGGFKKNHKMTGHPPMPPPQLWETLILLKEYIIFISCLFYLSVYFHSCCFNI